jgi:hypothetical protein
MANHNLLQSSMEPFHTRNIMVYRIFLLFVLLLVIVSGNYAQVIENIPQNKSADGYQQEKVRHFRIGFISIAGVGFNKIPLGVTDEGKEVKISAGGGIGMGFDLGYSFNPKFEFSLAYTYKVTDLSMDINNASGSFEHGNFMLTGKYKTRMFTKVSFNFGGGIGLYNAGNMDIDFSEVPDGDRYVCRYKTAFGVHALAEVQLPIGKKWSLNAGGTIYGVNYNQMKSFDLNSSSVPVDMSPSEFKRLKGSGADIYTKISFHF